MVEEGIYTVSVSCLGAHIANSPFACEVAAAVTQPLPVCSSDQCECEWDTQPTECGVAAKLVLRAGRAGLPIQMEATLVESRQSAVPEDDTQECTVLDQGTGRYFGHFRPLFGGRYELSVRLDGHHVPGSPFSHWVLARHCHPRMSVIQFEGPSTASIGIPLGSQVSSILFAGSLSCC